MNGAEFLKIFCIYEAQTPTPNYICGLLYIYIPSVFLYLDINKDIKMMFLGLFLDSVTITLFELSGRNMYYFFYGPNR